MPDIDSFPFAAPQPRTDAAVGMIQTASAMCYDRLIT